MHHNATKTPQNATDKAVLMDHRVRAVAHLAHCAAFPYAQIPHRAVRCVSGEYQEVEERVAR